MLLAVVIAGRLILGTTYSLVQPALESHDETGHSAYVDYIATHVALPRPGGALTPYFDEGHQPPLYYVVPGFIGRVFGIHGQYQPPLNPFFLSGDGSRGVNAAVHVPQVEAAPWHGGLLLLHLARFWSVLLGGVAVFLTYLAGRLALPAYPNVALAGAAIVAFVPTSLGVTDAVTNDALVPVTFGLVLIAALLMLRTPSTRHAGFLGLAIGLSLLTKNSALIFLPSAVLVLLVLWWRARQLPSLLCWTAALYGTTIVVAGWWYARNRLLFGHWITDRQESSALINSPGFQGTAVLHSASGTFVGRLLTYSFRSFWVLMGWGTLGAPDVVYHVLLVCSLLALAGLVLLTIRRLGRQAGGRPALNGATWAGPVTLVIFSLLSLPEPLYRAIYYEAPTLVPGRYLLGAIGAIGLLLALGFSAFVRRLQVLLVLPPAGLAALAIWLLPNVVIPAYAAPPPVPAGTRIPNPVDVTFGAMHLIGYRVDATSVAPGGTLPVTLYWQALRPMHTAYTVGVHVVDRDGALLGAVDGYPGRGNLATPLWQPGVTYADPYDVPIHANAPAPQLGRLLIGVENRVIDPQPGNAAYLKAIPIPATDSAGRPITALLGRFRIGAPVVAAVSTPQYRLGDDLGLLRVTTLPSEPHAGGNLQLDLQFQALKAPLPPLVIFAHLLRADGTLAAAAPDAQPLKDRYPTDLWPAREVVDDRITIPLPPILPAGRYRLEIGAYRRGAPQARLPVTAGDGAVQPENRVIVATTVLGGA